MSFGSKNQKVINMKTNKLLAWLAVSSMLWFGTGCSKKPDPLIEVKIISVRDPVAKGEGWGREYHYGGTLFEIVETGERIFRQSQCYGIEGDTFKIRESKLR